MNDSRIGLLSLALSFAVAACQQPDPPDEEFVPDPAELDSLYPLVDGANWTYDNLDAVGMVTDVEVVTSTAIANAKFLVVDSDDPSGEHTEAVIERIESAALRTHKEVVQNGTVTMIVDYDPGFTRMDDAWTTAGESFSPTYTRTETDGAGGNLMESVREHRFDIVAIDESVTVPAGTFDCIRVLRTRMDPGPAMGEEVTFWYAAGVGKVKEERVDRSEELSAFDIPGGMSSG